MRAPNGTMKMMMKGEYAMKAPLARIVSRARRSRTAARVMAEAESRGSFGRSASGGAGPNDHRGAVATHDRRE